MSKRRMPKLEVREDSNVEVTENKTLKTLPEQRNKLRKLLQSKTLMFDHTYPLQNVSAPLSPIKLSVNAEKELDWCIKEVNKNDNDDSVAKKSRKGCKLSSTQRKKKLFIPVIRVNLDKMYKISDQITQSSTNPVDKYLGVELKNMWGCNLKPEEDYDPHNELIQKALHALGVSVMTNESWKAIPLIYQCRLCNLAWWYFGPFRDHIRFHDHKTLNVFYIENQHEYTIIASNDLSAEPLYIQCEGDCYKCGKDFDYHLNLKTANPVYRCKECWTSISTCSMLLYHEPVCYEMIKGTFPKIIKCYLCMAQFLNDQDLKVHMSTVHVVRSDIPVPFSFYICSYCQKKCYNDVHMCTINVIDYSCKHCYRKFAKKAFTNFHIMVMSKKDYECMICNLLMPSKCMATEHLLSHTDNYRMAYKCCYPVCSPLILFSDEISVKQHVIKFHNQKYSKRTSYELILVPEQYVKPEFVDASEHLAACNLEAYGLVEDAKKKLKKNETTSIQTEKYKFEVALQENVKIKEEEPNTMETEYTDRDSQDSEMDYEQMLSKVFKISSSEPTTSKVMKVSSWGKTEKKSGTKQTKKLPSNKRAHSVISGSEQTLSKVLKVSESEQSLSKVFEITASEPTTSKAMKVSSCDQPTKVSGSEQTLSKVFEVSKSEQSLSKVFEISTSEPTTSKAMKVSSCEQTKNNSNSEQANKFPGNEQTVVSGSEQTLSKMTESEQPLSEVFKDSNSVQTSLPLLGALDIQIKVEREELDFDDLIDTQYDPITIKEEPMEACQFDEMYAKEQCNIEDTSPVNEFDIDGPCNIKTEPQEYEIDEIYNNDVIDLNAVKIEPEDVKQELLEATDIKIMETFSQTPEADILRPPPIIKPPPKRKPTSRRRKQKKIKVAQEFNKITSKNNIVVSKDFEENVTENALDQNPLLGNAEESVTENTLDQNALLRNAEENVTESTDQNALSKNVEENATENTREQNRKIKKAPTVLTNSKRSKMYACTRCGYANTHKLYRIHVKSKCELLPEADGPNQYTYSKRAKVFRQKRIYTCNKCGYSSTHKLYRIHVDSKCGSLSPDESLKYIKSRERRQKHIYTCKKCGYSNTHKLFRIHVNTKCEFLTADNGPNKYTCTKCDTSFRTLKSYLLHFNKHGYELLHCPSCNFKFESLEDLLLHFYEHVRDNFVNCWMINKKLELPTKQNRCQICREVVPQECFFSHFETHLTLTSKIKVEPEPIAINLDLPVNSKKALRPSVLSIALQELRKASWEKSCFICHRKFNRRNDCKRHVIEHLYLDAYSRKENTPEHTLRCQICFEDFLRADQYKFHMREHGRLPVYQCDLCNKTFSDSSNFAKHKKIHSLKVLICDMCQKKFHAKSMLEKHMILHRDTEPIKCELCEKYFFTPSLYNKHMKVHDVQKFRCIPCDICFDSLRKKWDHDWAVHKERKYKADCPMCEKEFRKFHDVKKHAKIEHKVEISYYKMKSEQAATNRKTYEMKKRRDGSLLVTIGIRKLPRKTSSSAAVL